MPHLTTRGLRSLLSPNGFRLLLRRRLLLLFLLIKRLLIFLITFLERRLSLRIVRFRRLLLGLLTEIRFHFFPWKMFIPRFVRRSILCLPL